MRLNVRPFRSNDPDDDSEATYQVFRANAWAANIYWSRGTIFITHGELLDNERTALSTIFDHEGTLLQGSVEDFAIDRTKIFRVEFDTDPQRSGRLRLMRRTSNGTYTEFAHSIEKEHTALTITRLLNKYAK
jgi:hypothetical protein